jgi:drug/metabolite transporter (DMT)-like permease
MPNHGNKVLNFLFDLRMIIAILFAVYGVICVIWGAGFTPASQLDKAGGININLWAGIGMLVVAGLFLWWTLAKPIEQAAAHSAEESEAEARRNV